MGRAMSQTRRGSAVEAVVGVGTGFLVSLAAAPLVYPFFGHAFTMSQNIGITLVFTVLSLLRGYAVRRLFVWLAKKNEAIEAVWASIVDLSKLSNWK